MDASLIDRLRVLAEECERRGNAAKGGAKWEVSPSAALRAHDRAQVWWLVHSELDALIREAGVQRAEQPPDHTQLEDPMPLSECVAEVRNQLVEREKVMAGAHITLDIDGNPINLGDVRAFVEASEGLPDDTPVIEVTAAEDENLTMGIRVDLGGGHA